ncbi:MAG: sn-glycerol 3-phosphate transport system permease protein [Chloroflexota bacterium]|jgi:ABC-type sugar transport system permease subunit|nr:sn-glycerol 3-phosphate transport system permease protein [Chloroflexota bacterium]
MTAPALLASVVNPAGRVGQLREATRDLGWAALLALPALAVFATFTFLPFVRAIWLSLNVTDIVGSPVTFVGPAYYLRILGLDDTSTQTYLRSILTTVEFTLLVVPVSIVGPLALALLANQRLSGIAFFRTIFSSPVAISVASASVVFALLYNPSVGVLQWLVNGLGLHVKGVLLDPATALPAVALVTIWTASGFHFIILLAGLQGIPEDLHEGAQVDGAGRWRILTRVTLPLLTPTLMFLVIISTINAFQAFTQFNVLIASGGPGGSTNVLVFALYSSFFKDNRYGFASAISVVLFIVLLALSLLQYKLLERRVHYQ